MKKEQNKWLSQKAVDYILAPKRGSFNYINPDICSTLTARGPEALIGTFISPDIVYVEHDLKVGSRKPVVIHLVNGKTLLFDGKNYVEQRD